MIETTPAAELRTAAETLRRLATLATPGPWERDSYAVHGADGCYVTEPWTSDETDPDLDLIAAMGPTVALALADALTSIVRAVEMDLIDRVGYRELLAVARAVNAKEDTDA